MLLNSWQFFGFLGTVLVLHYALPLAARKYLLLVASYVFYMSWNAKYTVLLLALTAIDFAAGILIERLPVKRKRVALIGSLAVNLGLLGFFKYHDFFADILVALFGHQAQGFAASIILPLGISFHTFQSMSYVIDVYRGEQRAIRNPVDYALFISFFPQLMAGPIVRAHEFFSNLTAWRSPSSEEWRRGVLLLLLGLAKKAALADQFALVADQYFKEVTAQTGRWAAISGVFAFDMQIYLDFSGYTDMAIGMALMLGFRFPENFRQPYLAQSITEFWRRWHISLSNWLRDYLWFPLGGNRHGRFGTCRNLMITMLLGGLWHGAGWNFLIWGGWHGALLSAENALGVRAGRQRHPWLAPVRVLSTFLLVSVGWVLFRARTLNDATIVLRQMVFKGGGRSVCPPWLVCAAVMCAILAVLEQRYGWFDRVVKGPAWAYAVTAALLLFSVELLSLVDVTVPFVYFRF